MKIFLTLCIFSSFFLFCNDNDTDKSTDDQTLKEKSTAINPTDSCGQKDLTFGRSE